MSHSMSESAFPSKKEIDEELSFCSETVGFLETERPCGRKPIYFVVMKQKTRKKGIREIYGFCGHHAWLAQYGWRPNCGVKRIDGKEVPKLILSKWKSIEEHEISRREVRTK